MSARGSLRRPVKGQARMGASRSSAAPGAPSAASRPVGGTSVPAEPPNGHAVIRQQQVPPPQPIDVEAIEDDVELLPSTRGVPQARNHSRRRRPEMVILDDDVEVNPGQVNPGRSGVPTEESVISSTLNTRNKRTRISSNRTVINCETYVNSEDRHDPKRESVVKSPPEPEKVALKEPTFNCPICMNALVEASSTICGHIFCQSCIKTSIQGQKKCPICARKLRMNNFHRVYLPSSD